MTDLGPVTSSAENSRPSKKTGACVQRGEISAKKTGKRRKKTHPMMMKLGKRPSLPKRATATDGRDDETMATRPVPKK